MAGGWGDVELAERSKIYYIAGSWDPTVQATLAPEGSMYLRVGAGGGALYQKLDNGTTTNWVLNQTSGGGGGAIPVTNNIYVEENGNDTTGDGSISAPVQTINKAITLCSNPALVYAIVPGTGTYNGADVTWLPNVNLFGNGSPVINNNINYTSPAASESYFTFQNIKMGGLLTLDLAPAAIAIHTFTTGSFNIDRVDAAPIGPWAILISDATLGDSSFGGSCILSNILFVSSMEIKAGGRVVASNCPLGIPIDMYDDAYISLQASNTQGAVFTGHPTGLLIPSIVTDTDSFAGASYTDCTIQYANLTGNLINGQVLSGGTVTASQAGSVASVKVDGLGNLASATAEGAYVRGYVHGTTGSELKAEGIASSAIGRPSNGGKILAVGANSLAQGYASGANIEANNQCSTAQGFTDSGGIISSTGISAFARGYAETGGIILSSGLSSNAFGYSLGGGSITSSGQASLAFGKSEGGTIISQGSSSLAFGIVGPETGNNIRSADGSLCFGTHYGTNGRIGTTTGIANYSGNMMFGTIEANATGSIGGLNPVKSSLAIGYLGANATGSVTVRDQGCFSLGTLAASSTGSVTSRASSISLGIINSSGSITSNNGSFSFGKVTGSAVIESNNTSLAHGTSASTNEIKSIGVGCHAHGLTLNGYLYASGNGCHAGGYALTGSVQTSGNANFIHGDDINFFSTNFAASFGQGHIGNLDHQFIVGRYSDNTLMPIFCVGNGVLGTPSNAFEVLPNGNYRTKGYQTQKVNVVSIFDYTINSAGIDDLVIAVTTVPGQKVFMPLAPSDGDTYKVKCDVASTDMLDIDGNGLNIEALGVFSISPGNAVTLVYGNGKWQLISMF